VDMFKSSHKLYYWGLATYEKSFSLKVDNRFQIGAGIGYSLLSKPTASLVLSDGLLYETSSLSKADLRGITDYETIRNSFRIKFRFLIKDLIKIEGSDFLQNSLSDGDDYIIKSNTSVSVKIYKWLNLAMVLNYNRQNITATENLLVTYGLTFDRYF
ncbi:MAG: DUF481 domain-containing protein, partial [Chitinophagaceae bacterium]|nr:DUF481 domain-containing protein [Chitinophagaceae bacterium]